MVPAERPGGLSGRNGERVVAFSSDAQKRLEIPSIPGKDRRRYDIVENSDRHARGFITANSGLDKTPWKT